MTEPQTGFDAGRAGGGLAAVPGAIPRLSSARLLGPEGEAVIEHDGQVYRLRRTSRGGLVLTK